MSDSQVTGQSLGKIDEAVRESAIPYEYRTKDYPLEVLRSKFGEEDDPQATLFVPAYQRQYVWDLPRRSRFIESVLLGVPLTPFLVSEDHQGRLEIIDGSQRIRTLIAFREDNLILRDLDKLKGLEGFKYSTLPRRLQITIDNRDFKVIVVSEKATLEIRRDIFNRINTSSLDLKDSEVRKGVYSGPFFDFIVRMKQNEKFIKLCPITKAKNARGEHEELLLRFFAYSERYQYFRHDVAAFLDGYLDEMNHATFEPTSYEARFTRMLDFVEQHFEYGFAKDRRATTTPRVRFEAISVGVHLALEEKPDLVPTSMNWLRSKEFSDVTTSDGSNSTNRLRTRIHFVKDCLLGITTERPSNADGQD